MKKGTKNSDEKLSSGVFMIATSIAIVLALAIVWGGGRAEAQASADQTKACLECHTDYGDNLQKTVHKVSSEEAASRLPQVFCTSCHGDATKHLEEPSVENILNPAKAAIFDGVKSCLTCHSSTHVREYSETSVHFRQNVSCLDCHSIHQPKAERLLAKPSVPLCLGCHTEIKQKLAQASHHPVNDKVMKCISCHGISGEPGKTFSQARADEACFNCHAEFQGPFFYEHQAANDYGIEKAGCMSCHDPHGSPNPRLLLQPVKHLCLQCHAVPKHRTVHNGVYANRSCSECHTDVHGSYTNEKFFNETILAQNCFLPACHGN